MCLFVSVLTFIEGGQQEIGAQVLFAVREVKPSQIIVVCIWPPNAIQKSQLAAIPSSGAGMFDTLEKRLKQPQEP